jgi:hypothetical protein
MNIKCTECEEVYKEEDEISILTRAGRYCPEYDTPYCPNCHAEASDNMETEESITYNN